MSSGGDEWERRLSGMLTRAENWRDLGVEPEVPQPHSSLAADDRGYTQFPVSQVAWLSLLSATDHIDLFLTALQATRRSQPYAYFTVARGALIGAARAFWVLHPSERAERQRRALRVAHEDHRQYRAALQTLRDLIDGERQQGVHRTPEQRASDQRIRDESDRQADTSTERLAEIIAVGADALKMTAGQFRLSDTQIIEYAANALPPDTDPWARRGLVLFWRTGSGYSHALRWTSLLGATQVGPAGASLTNVRVAASAQDLFTAITGPVILVEHALGRYRRQAQPQY